MVPKTLMKDSTVRYSPTFLSAASHVSEFEAPLDGPGGAAELSRLGEAAFVGEVPDRVAAPSGEELMEEEPPSLESK